MVPSRVKQDPRLSVWDLRVLLALLELSYFAPDGESLLPVSTKALTVARMLGEASRTGRELARRALLRLETYGYLTRDWRRGRAATYDLNPAWGMPPMAEVSQEPPAAHTIPEQVDNSQFAESGRTDNSEVVTTDNRGVVGTDNRRVVTTDNAGVVTYVSDYACKSQAERVGLSDAGLATGLQIASGILGYRQSDLESWWVRDVLTAFAAMPPARNPDRAFAGFMRGEARKRADVLRQERSIPQL